MNPHGGYVVRALPDFDHQDHLDCIGGIEPVDAAPKLEQMLTDKSISFNDKT